MYGMLLEYLIYTMYKMKQLEADNQLFNILYWLLGFLK